MTKLSEQILQEAFENPSCDGCWGRLQLRLEELEDKISKLEKENNELQSKSYKKKPAIVIWAESEDKKDKQQ